MTGGTYQERIAEAMSPIYWRRRNDPDAPAMKAHAWELLRKADLVLAALKADGWTPPDALADAFCEHHEEPAELDSEEHLASCLLDGPAAQRLASREAEWDMAGTNGYEL